MEYTPTCVSLCMSMFLFQIYTDTHIHTQTQHLFLFVDIHICTLKASVILPKENHWHIYKEINK